MRSVEAVAEPGNCAVLSVSNGESIPDIFVPRSVGTYCLAGDVVQRKVERLDGKPLSIYGTFIVNLKSRDSAIDFAGYAVTSLYFRRGGVSTLDSGRGAASGAQIRNGHLRMKDGGSAIQLPYDTPSGSLFSDVHVKIHLGRPVPTGDPNAVTPGISKYLGGIGEYRPTEYLIDNMEVIAGEYGIRLMGRYNRITNSRIEVTDSKSAIYLFGPDNVIENNIIVFRGKGATPSAAPIKLHHGDRTVIRNNVIIIEGPDQDARQAVSLIESRDVVLEGNRVYGSGPVVHPYGEGSSFRMGALVVDDREHAPRIPEQARAASDIP
ncbi:MAG: right-handed parallel beta-helix repeat-containing protein [Burkholderiaceae bacterium]